MESHFLRGLSGAGFHRLHVALWGEDKSTHTAVCVHGLTRQGRDFDALARSLAAAGWRVACPDVVGRGSSGWLKDPAGYGYPQYMADAAVVLGHLGADEVDWVGTSMGGLLGMMLAALPETPIRRLVVNDVGPFIPAAALRRLGTFVGRDPRFSDMANAEAYMRQVAAPFGALSDAQWRHLTEHCLAALPEGGYRLAYDPAIGAPFRAEEISDVDLWGVWDRIAAPTLVLRGAESDLLLAETAAEMTTRGPRAELVEVPGCGHVPALLDEAQIALVRDWLRKPPPARPGPPRAR